MTIRGPALFLAQFLGDEPPFSEWGSLCQWAASLGYLGVQVPTWDPRAIDLDQAAQSKSYCEDYRARLASDGLEVTELSTHLQGQLIAVHPAYDSLTDGFAPAALRGQPSARTEWARQQLISSFAASRNLGLDVTVTFSGSLAWPYAYPWPPRPPGLIEEAFRELAQRWRPLLDAADEHGVDVAFEIHPGEDLHDGASFERFLDAVAEHPRATINYDPSHFELMDLDYLAFIDIYHERIRGFHVKDAERQRSGRSGVYGGYQEWPDRSTRFRSLGDGRVDFKGIFTRLTQRGYRGWAVVEWECAYKDAQVGAAEGAEFVKAHLIPVTQKSFDDFAGGADPKLNRELLGLDRPEESA